MPDQSHATASFGPILRRLAAAGAASALVLSIAGPPAAIAGRATGVGHASATRITRVGTGHMAKTGGHGEESAEADPEFGPIEADELDAQAPGSQAAKRVPADHVPAPAGLSVNGAAGATSFDGLDHYDQRITAGTGIYANTDFSTEPPDMGLCIGNGFIVQGANTAVRVFSMAGTPLTAPTSMNQLFGVQPAVDRTQANQGIFHYGDDVGDVKCYYDADVNRFFISGFRLPLDPDTGGYPTDESHVMLDRKSTCLNSSH